MVVVVAQQERINYRMEEMEEHQAVEEVVLEGESVEEMEEMEEQEPEAKLEYFHGRR